ncbi:NAD(P)-dependent oxidoreductase [Bordetella petrii]|uniref:NAD(P)-dependent oxidoreductase n=1 Tax=Bordetella petrii TaxID=94624 RepID=UPI001E58E742|nr:NAD(P)-dependent oxidoreductase [Bordetella petrii]MCD0501881.1 NAD(P)-dependent oxidoreductase [Bordetella petrii]
MAMRIGFIGLGQMGFPMFQNLSRKLPGAEVLGYDKSAARMAQLRENGQAAGLAPGQDALAGLDVLITMLPNGAAVRACLLGEQGGTPLGRRLAAGATVIDMSSSSPMDTRQLARELGETGINLVDAPVSGSVPKARDGTLAIMAGGEDAVIERMRPLFLAMGAKLIKTGAVGSAHGMKALNNYVYAAGLLAMSEALLLGKSMDLDLGVLIDVMNVSSGRNVATETKARQHMLNGGDFKAGFGLHLMAKDLGIAAGLREQAGFNPPQLALCQELWQHACTQLPVDADNTEIYRYLAARLGAAL